MSTVKALRWCIDEEHWVCFYLNTLEFVASFVCLWVAIINSAIQAGDCVLSEIDSIFAKGWLYKSNAVDFDQASQMTIARKMLVITNTARIVLHAKWLKGELNTLSDYLSYYHKMPGVELIQIMRLFVPKQIEDDFEINPLC
jgi:hypothetical protein